LTDYNKISRLTMTQREMPKRKGHGSVGPANKGCPKKGHKGHKKPVL